MEPFPVGLLEDLGRRGGLSEQQAIDRSLKTDKVHVNLNKITLVILEGL